MIGWTNIILTVYAILTLILSLCVDLLRKEIEDRRELQYSLAELTLNLSKKINQLERRQNKL